MPLEDITTTGGRDLKGIRNPDLYPNSSPTLEEMRAQSARVEADLNRGRIGYEDTGAPGWIEPTPMPELGDYGASRYDTELIANPQDQWDVANMRAANQGSLTKVAAAIPQAVTTAGTTFAQGTVGLLYGAGSAVINGEFNRLWNNDFTEAMDAVNTAVQEVAPIYQSQDEQENPLRNLFSAGPLAANIGQLAGFIAGAAYSGSTYMRALEGLGRGVDAVRAGKGTFKAISGLAKSSKNNMATQAAASILGANGEATIEAFGNTKDWAEYNKTKLNDYYTSNALEFFTQATNAAVNEVDPRQYPTREDYINAIQLRASQIVDQSRLQREAEIDDASIRMGNVIWAENMALLGFTHYKTLGRVYSGGYRANKTLANFVRRSATETGEVLEPVKKGAIRNISESLGKAAYEGVEEMSQSAFSKGAGYWTEQDIYEPLREKRNRAGEAETFNILTGLAEGARDQLADPNNWVEFIMGMSAGMLPIPIPHRKANGSIGIFRSPEMVNTFKENREMNRLAEETVERINAIRSTPQYQTLADALIVDAVKENKKKGSLGDEFAYKSEDYAQLVNLVTALEQVDQVDLFSDEIQSIIDMQENEENGSVILEGLSKDGEVPEYLKNKTPIEIVREYKEKAQQVQENIKNIVTNSENIRATYGDQLTNDALHSLVTLKSQLDNWNQRYKQISQEIPSYIREIEVDPADPNIGTLISSLRDNSVSLSFKDESVDKLNSRLQKVIREAAKGKYQEESITEVANKLSDMYRLGMSLRNGIVTFNSITFDPASFNQKVDKENKKEEKKRQKENVEGLKDRFNEVQTLGDFRNLETSSSPEEFSALMKSLEDSKDPKLKELNQKRGILGSITTALYDADIPTELADALGEVIEEVVDSNPAEALLAPDSGILFELPVNNTLSRLLASNNFGLDGDQLTSLPTKITEAYIDALQKIRKRKSRIPEVASPRNETITFDDGTSYTPDIQEESTAFETDLKESSQVLSPLNPKSENPTVAPTTTPVPQEMESSRENLGEISGGVSEVNYHALRYTGEVITPVNRDRWNEYARQNGLTEVDENFVRIYNYLVDKGAYSYLNQGNLKVEDTVVAFTDSTFGDTVFFGKPLKAIEEIENISDLQVIQAAPSSYNFGDKIVKSKDGTISASMKQLSVAQVFNGKYRYSEDAPLNRGTISSLFPEGVKEDWAIGIISNNGRIYSSKNITEDMVAHDNPFTAEHDGRVYLFVKGPNGRYMPQSLRVANFTGSLDGLIGEKILNAVRIMSLAVNEDPGNNNHPQLNSGLEELSKYIYTGNLVAAITNFVDGPGVMTKHLALIKKGKNGEPDIKEYVYLTEPRLGGEARNQEDIIRDIVTALTQLGINYQVAKNSLRTDKGYQTFLLEAGILSSNVLPSPIVDTNFSLVERNYDSGKIITTPSPAPANPSPVTEAPTLTPQVGRRPPQIFKGSKPFNLAVFEEALRGVPSEIRDIFAGLDGKSMKIERQMLFALALLSDPKHFESIGGLQGVVTYIRTATKKEFPSAMEFLTKELGINKTTVLPQNRAIYDRIRSYLTEDNLLESAYEANKATLMESKDGSTQTINNFQKDLEIKNKLLTFAELTESQRDGLSKVGITEEEFNSWSRDQQNKAIECYS